MQLEDSDRAVTRQGDGQTGYDGAVQPAVVGMEVERSTDEAAGLGRDATGVTTTGSTDTAATDAGMDVTTTGSTDTAAADAGMDVTTTDETGGTTTGPTGTTAMRAAAPRRYRTGALEGLTRGERRKLAKAKKKAAR